MILQTALKYLIFNQCINVFFDQLHKNLKTLDISKIPRIGETFSRIVAKDNSDVFYICKVTNVYLNEDSTDFLIEIEYNGYDFHDLDVDPEEDDFSYEYDSELIDDEPDMDVINYSEYNFIK